MYQCEICGEWGRGISLAGHFPAHLCLKHERAWDEFCQQAGIYAILRDTQAEIVGIGLAIRAGARHIGDLVDAYERERRATNELYALAKGWLEEQVEAGKSEC